MNTPRVLRAWLMALLPLLMAACSSIGPATVTRDRLLYNDEVAKSWKQQTLLNIVKARYLDVPVFLDVAQIVSGYTLQGTVSLSGSTAGATPSAGSVGTIGAQGSWTDRPTITYTPLTGAQFNRNMMTPITPTALFFTIEAGWPADLVFRLTVQTINGLSATSEGYGRIAALLRSLQLSQAFSMRVQGDPKGLQGIVLLFRNRGLTAEQISQMKELRQLLGLAAGNSEFNVTYGVVQANDDEIAIQTRSILQILLMLGGYVEVPETDLREGRVPAGAPPSPDPVGRVAIKYSHDKPADALVEAAYRGGWFWIDDRDLESKRAFSLTMLLTTLTETGARDALPLVTISSG